MALDSSNDFVFFIQRFLKDPLNVGAILPSSRSMAHEITRFINDSPHKHFLEVGPGTGVLTDVLLEKMDSSSYLDLVEINEDFCERLREKYKNNHNINVVNTSILEWNPPYYYDGVISSLPLNAFQPEMIAAIFEKFHNLIVSNGTLSYYEYISLPKLKKLFLSRINRKQFNRTLTLIQDFCRDYQIEERIIWANFPPGKVHHCKMLHDHE